MAILSPYDQRLFTQLVIFYKAECVLELCSWIMQRMHCTLPQIICDFYSYYKVKYYHVMGIESRKLELNLMVPQSKDTTFTLDDVQTLWKVWAFFKALG